MSSDRRHSLTSKLGPILLIMGGLVIGLALALVIGRLTGVEPWRPALHSTNGMSAEQLADWSANPHFFERTGADFVSRHPHMAQQRFPADKSANEFRVFLIGGSQALGDPYVHAAAAIGEVNTETLGITNGGGIATWLQRYFEKLYPQRSVLVVNAAVGSQNLETTAHVFADVADIGSADLVIVISGNNEAFNVQFSSFDAFAEKLNQLTKSYAVHLLRIIELAEERRIPTYLLTVASNLRDWLPSQSLQPVASAETDRFLDQEAWQEAVARFSGSDLGRHALAVFFQGRANETAGQLDLAYGNYLEAKDRDFNLIRAHSRWNELLRSADGGLVKTIDAERLLRQYADNEVPGFDLFHDNCHYTIRANMLIAKEIALAHQRIAGLTPTVLADLDVSPLLEQSLRSLYAIKQAKWARLRKHDSFDYLGDRNRANVAGEFRKLEQELRGVESYIDAYESDRSRRR